MSTLVRWEPFRELASLQGDMNRWLNSVFGEGQTRDVRNWVPALDVWETDNDVVYAFDLPGIPEDRISIEVKDDTLTVSAERVKTEETTDDRYFRFERRYGSFSRAVGLPQGVDEDQISASYRNGVLEIRVPKPAEQKPHKIELTKTVEAGTNGG
jgi:HSP20 family protein